MDTKITIAERLAREHGFDIVRFHQEWNGYDAYYVDRVERNMIDSNTYPYCPTFILVKGDESRFVDIYEKDRLFGLPEVLYV